MKIECILKRAGGTKAEIGGIEYHFAPQDDGSHVADVENEAHQDRFLSINEAYRLYRPKAKDAPSKPAKAQEPGLIGSDVHPDTFDINGKAVSLGDVVAGAFKASGMTVEAWNAQDANARHDLIDAYLDELANKQDPEAEKAALVEQYVAKFGKKPHYTKSADQIRAMLED